MPILLGGVIRRCSFVSPRDGKQCDNLIPKRRKDNFCGKRCRENFKAKQERDSLIASLPDRHCKLCGDEFKSHRKSQLFCDRECTKVYWNTYERYKMWLIKLVVHEDKVLYFGPDDKFLPEQDAGLARTWLRKKQAQVIASMLVENGLCSENEISIEHPADISIGKEANAA